MADPEWIYKYKDAREALPAIVKAARQARYGHPDADVRKLAKIVEGAALRCWERHPEDVDEKVDHVKVVVEARAYAELEKPDWKNALAKLIHYKKTDDVKKDEELLGSGGWPADYPQVVIALEEIIALGDASYDPNGVIAANWARICRDTHPPNPMTEKAPSLTAHRQRVFRARDAARVADQNGWFDCINDIDHGGGPGDGGSAPEERR